MKVKIYEELKELTNNIPRYDITILLKDFNAKIDKEPKFNPNAGKNSLVGKWSVTYQPGTKYRNGDKSYMRISTR